MAQYKLTYARVVILETVIEADDEDQAYTKASELEGNVKLGIRKVAPIKGSTVRDIVDYDVIWEVEKV